MSREKLPDRRAAWRQSARIDNQRFYLTVGEYDDGRPGEVFLTAHRYGTFARGVLDALARVTSLALQCGSPLGEVVKALSGLNFPPNGPVVCSGNVSEATSVADWVARELAAAYPDRVGVL